MFQDRIGFMASLGFARAPAERVVADLAALGYRAVEWTSAHFDPRARTAAELEGIVEATRKAGLAVSSVVVQQDYVHPDPAVREDRIARTLETIEACSGAGVDTVSLFTGPAPWDPKAPRVGDDLCEGEAWDMVLAAYERIAAALQRHRVRGAVEGVWGHLCDDYYSTRLLLDRFASPWLGVNFDPSHDVLKGLTDTGWIVRQWGEHRIHHVHLKDAAGIPEAGKFVFPLPGEGRVDWKGMFAALAAIGYGGWLSVEFESFAFHDRVLKGDTREAARMSIEAVRALLREEPS